MHIFHKWSKWEQYNCKVRVSYWTGTENIVRQERERRKCEVCGKAQDRKVKGSL